MEQQIQHSAEIVVGTSEQRKYMSVWSMLGGGLLNITMVSLMLVQGANGWAGIDSMLFFIPVLITTLSMAIVTAALGSSLGKPVGYLRTWFVDVIFLTPVVAIIFLTIPAMRSDILHEIPWVAFASLASTVALSIFFNHTIFQKTEAEIAKKVAK